VLILYITDIINKKSTNSFVVLQGSLSTRMDLSDPKADLSNVLILHTDELLSDVPQNTLAHWCGADWLFCTSFRLATGDILITLDEIK